jgi:excisionase family DNA binding protein
VFDRREHVRNAEDPSSEFEVEAKTWNLDHSPRPSRSVDGEGNTARLGGLSELTSGDDLLRPREVAKLFGVRPSTIARWAREGKLRPLLTPGGHRRYLRSETESILGSAEVDQAQEGIERDAVRLYEQGWTIRQVADRFSLSYGVMRRILGARTTLRHRGGVPR